jgi:hypothetical protein
MCRKLIALLAVILFLELVKTAIYSLLVKPEGLDQFFAGSIKPLMQPVAMSILVGVSVGVCGIVALAMGKRDENDR